MKKINKCNKCEKIVCNSSTLCRKCYLFEVKNNNNWGKDWFSTPTRRDW